MSAFLAVALLSVIVFPTTSQAQTAVSPRGIISAAGGTLEHVGASLSWTVGDVSAGQYTTSEVRLREGFLSVPLRVMSVAPLPAAWDLELFPNPVRADLTIAFTGSHPAITLQLFDLAGRLLRQGRIDDDVRRHLLSMGQLPPGNYFLRVHENGGAQSAVYQVKKVQ